MNNTVYITTSWDDGHPLDLRIAELLAKYSLQGTFYVPVSGQHETMTTGQLRELSRIFEIGAHTLDHVILTRTSDEQAWQQILASRAWVEEVTGTRCLMFCPPQGKFTTSHVNMAKRAGYIGLRSVELASTEYPRWQSGLLLMPTSVQAYPHSTLAICRNLAKRRAVSNAWRYVRFGGSLNWPALADLFLECALRGGGVFHLWGHSWELHETGQWQRLEEVMQAISEFRDAACVATNGGICGQFSSPSPAGPLRH